MRASKEFKILGDPNYATKDKGQFLMVDSVNGKLRKNFNEVLN